MHIRSIPQEATQAGQDLEVRVVGFLAVVVAVAGAVAVGVGVDMEEGDNKLFALLGPISASCCPLIAIA
jgi:hypothetical protein